MEQDLGAHRPTPIPNPAREDGKEGVDTAPRGTDLLRETRGRTPQHLVPSGHVVHRTPKVTCFGRRPQDGGQPTDTGGREARPGETRQATRDPDIGGSRSPDIRTRMTGRATPSTTHPPRTTLPCFGRRMTGPTEWDAPDGHPRGDRTGRRTPRGRTWSGDKEAGADPSGRPGAGDEPATPGQPGTPANQPDHDLPAAKSEQSPPATTGGSALDVERTARTGRQGLRRRSAAVDEGHSSKGANRAMRTTELRSERIVPKSKTW
jgi:hypothetical protein